MAGFEPSAAGEPCWIDLYSSNPDRARSFYQDIFGWTTQDAGAEFGGYVNFLKDGVPVAGMMENTGDAGVQDGWTIYLSTPDINATVDAAVANGGQIAFPPTDVGDFGSMATLLDPGGAWVGVWQYGKHRGFGVIAEQGAPAWFELHTRAYSESVKFYQDVFKWDAHVASNDKDFRYTTLGKGEGQKAGIMDITGGRFNPEAPANWSVYIGVKDVDATLDRILELDGTIVEPAEDSPYGRLAKATDPTGAGFKLVSV
jgi:predicted enzyme related to lactoylglutathione lyase